ncbi:hypothetical protein [Mycoplasma suis]|uniref:Uncharacterized protein n=1 Tax=Mycoplasma suis (strain Illinois) TaxID=768700 RepID=F0QRM3_MYCSL|nr:hypothetical protein [Mycoplasma suis]ADX98143.1 hypothetical protein MSU_0611 [Mycoplasma suis str. Illinois]
MKKVQNISSESQRSRRRREVSVVLDSKNKKVLKALEQIKWDEEINWDSLHKNWSSKNWNEENLFYPLLESEMIWKEWLKTVEEAQKEHDEYVNNGWRRFCGLLMIGSCYTEQESLKQKIKNAKKSLELRIGESLMKGMKRVISNFH